MPPKMKMWSIDVEMKMIQEIENRPVLWDVTSSIYKRADLKPAAWAEVASALEIPIITAEIVAKRWKNIKETFMKNLARVKECKNKSSGNGADDGFQPTWYLYKRLLFLMKTCAQAESESNLPSQPVSVICNNTDLPFNNIYYDENIQKFMIVPKDTSNVINSNETLDNSCDILADISVSPGPSSDSAEIISSTFSTPPHRPASAPINNVVTTKRPCQEDHFFNKRGSGIREAKNKSSVLLEGAVKAMEKIASQPIPSFNSEVDASDAFCSFVATRLRSMKEETRKECENEILQVLTKY